MFVILQWNSTISGGTHSDPVGMTNLPLWNNKACSSVPRLGVRISSYFVQNFLQNRIYLHSFLHSICILCIGLVSAINSHSSPLQDTTSTALFVFPNLYTTKAIAKKFWLINLAGWVLIICYSSKYKGFFWSLQRSYQSQIAVKSDLPKNWYIMITDTGWLLH